MVEGREGCWSSRHRALEKATTYTKGTRRLVTSTGHSGYGGGGGGQIFFCQGKKRRRGGGGRHTAREELRTKTRRRKEGKVRTEERENTVLGGESGTTTLFNLVDHFGRERVYSTNEVLNNITLC